METYWKVMILFSLGRNGDSGKNLTGRQELRLILLSRDLDICQSGGSCGTVVTKILSSANWADFVAPNARGLKNQLVLPVKETTETENNTWKKNGKTKRRMKGHKKHKKVYFRNFWAKSCSITDPGTDFESSCWLTPICKTIRLKFCWRFYFEQLKRWCFCC